MHMRSDFDLELTGSDTFTTIFYRMPESSFARSQQLDLARMRLFGAASCFPACSKRCPVELYEAVRFKHLLPPAGCAAPCINRAPALH